MWNPCISTNYLQENVDPETQSSNPPLNQRTTFNPISLGQNSALWRKLSRGKQTVLPRPESRANTTHLHTGAALRAMLFSTVNSHRPAEQGPWMKGFIKRGNTGAPRLLSGWFGASGPGNWTGDKRRPRISNQSLLLESASQSFRFQRLLLSEWVFQLAN